MDYATAVVTSHLDRVEACERFGDDEVSDASCCEHRALDEWRRGHVPVKEGDVRADPRTH